MKPTPLSPSRLLSVLLLASALFPAAGAAQEEIYFSAVDNVRDVLVAHINAEQVRIDMSAWYLTDRAVSRALIDRHNAGVQVRLLGDRGSIFEIDEFTKREFYWLASQGLPIRLRYNPTWYPEIDHWKATIFVGQGVVTFGSANYTPFELAPVSSTNYKDETVLFTSDPALVAAFKTKFDRFWNDQTVEPESRISGPPYFRNWYDACAAESACSDYYTLYPNPVPMVIDTRRLEGDAPMPADMVWGQGPSFNNRLVTEINAETRRIDFVIYRLTVPNIAQALESRHAAGVPVRLIIEPNEYRNRKWPEFWLTGAYIDRLWALGVPIKSRLHDGLTHMKMLVTSRYATNASSNFAANWQRDHNYFVPAATKPVIYQAMADRFQTMWNDTAGFETFYPEPPDTPTLSAPAEGATGVSTTPRLTWNRAPFATNYDVYLGTSSASMTRVANVPASLVQDPPLTYSWSPSTALQGGTTYYWRVVARTNATPVDPSLVAYSATRSFTTTGTTPPPSSLPTPWATQDIGSVGLAGSATYSSEQFTVLGAGADIWGSADSFRFVYQALSGDGSITARLVSMQNTHAYAKAGVMLRTSLTAGSAHVVLDMLPGGGIEFMRRATTGGTTTYLGGTSGSRPEWLRLTRSGDNISSFVSRDGASWTRVGTTTVALGSTVYAGLVVCSHVTSTLNTSVFDQVSVQAGGTAGTAPAVPTNPSPANGATGVSTGVTLSWSAPGATSYQLRLGTVNPPGTVATGLTAASYTPGNLAAGTRYYWQVIASNSYGTTTGPVWSFTTATATSTLPTPWVSRDVGDVGQAGSASYTSGQFTVRGAGADIWGTADGFHFLYQPLSGDVTVTARLLSMQNTNAYAKAGVMLRTSLAANSAHVILDMVPGGGIEFMRRSVTGGTTTYLSGTTMSRPAWLRLSRSGDTITSFVSSDGATWTRVGATTVALGATVYAGVVVNSHDRTVLNTAVFDQVTAQAAASSASDVVIYASDVDAASVHGAISIGTDPASPNGVALVSTDTGFAVTSAPLASPTHYADITFDAQAATTYRIWLRLKALNDSKYNDAVWVQFSDALVNGAPAYRINTTSGLLVNLATDATATSLLNWGWQNGAYWLSQATAVTFASSGSHTIRIQLREDGVRLDQVVLSPQRYLSSAPGGPTDDHTIVSR